MQCQLKWDDDLSPHSFLYIFAHTHTLAFKQIRSNLLCTRAHTHAQTHPLTKQRCKEITPKMVHNLYYYHTNVSLLIFGNRQKLTGPYVLCCIYWICVCDCVLVIRPFDNRVQKHACFWQKFLRHDTTRHMDSSTKVWAWKKEQGNARTEKWERVGRIEKYC